MSRQQNPVKPAVRIADTPARPAAKRAPARPFGSYLRQINGR
jgi:hypothetical protein